MESDPSIYRLSPISASSSSNPTSPITSSFSALASANFLLLRWSIRVRTAMPSSSIWIHFNAMGIRSILRGRLGPSTMWSRSQKEFSSKAGYFSSFMGPLVEETRTELMSAITTENGSLYRGIKFLKKNEEVHKAPGDFLYSIFLKKVKNEDDPKASYQPKFGDLLAIGNSTSKKSLEKDYIVALVHKSEEDNNILVCLSKQLNNNGLSNLLRQMLQFQKSQQGSLNKFLF
ncbi:hypothetical protein TorRG33x02_196310 [Trema orientale]|uniref:Uncharacterized protein n=1 Tax=Trema orientale TaxID=63057 RepID=A0A2P5EGE0_TREOI|nr:hypothetical protein TorRG33x02_196310 [Trema orientale]